MGNILTPETPSVTTKIKTVLKKLDHHSAHISRRLNIIARETATIENRLKKNLQSRKSLGAGARRGYLAHEMSTQVRVRRTQIARTYCVVLTKACMFADRTATHSKTLAVFGADGSAAESARNAKLGECAERVLSTAKQH